MAYPAIELALPTAAYVDFGHFQYLALFES